MVDRLRLAGQLANFIVLALGAWFASQGAIFPHSILALMIGGFSLIVLTRVRLQAASKFVLLTPGIFGFIIGAMTLGGVVGLWMRGDPISPIMVAVGLSYVVAGATTVLWLLLMPPFEDAAD